MAKEPENKKAAEAEAQTEQEAPKAETVTLS